MAEPGRTHRVVPEIEPRIHKMLGHPLRHAIVMILGERVASPSQLAATLDEDPKRVSEQIELLQREEMVELVDKRPGPHGGVVHLYRAVDRHVFSAEEWATLPVVEKLAGSGAIYKIMHKNVVDALNSGSFDELDDRVIARLPIWTTPAGAKRIDQIMERALKEIGQVECDTVESEEPRIRMITALLSFLAAPEESAGTPENPRS